MYKRVQDQLKRFRLETSVADDRIIRLPAQPYAGYLELLDGSTCVLTDSWNVQEEATARGVPCITIGSFPERAITSSTGTNIAVGLNRALLTRTLWQYMFTGGKRGTVPAMWDGRTGARIAGYLGAWLSEGSVQSAPER
jgi:UDP-N-acetylglucosamine 2-epimerase (non-hydrolysing)